MESSRPRDRKEEMGTSRNWFKLVHRKFVRPSTRDIIVVCTNAGPSPHEERAEDSQDPNFAAAPAPEKKYVVTEQDTAAIKIQAFFRGHLVLSPPTLIHYRHPIKFS